MNNGNALNTEYQCDTSVLMHFLFSDDSTIELDIRSGFVCDILDCPNINEVSASIYWDPNINKTVFKLDEEPLKEFVNEYEEGSLLHVEVIDDYNPRFYLVRYNKVYGKIMKFPNVKLHCGQEVKATVYKIYEQSITFNYVRK